MLYYLQRVQRSELQRFKVQVKPNWPGSYKAGKLEGLKDLKLPSILASRPSSLFNCGLRAISYELFA
jgi:hypothetical protein